MSDVKIISVFLILLHNGADNAGYSLKKGSVGYMSSTISANIGMATVAEHGDHCHPGLMKDTERGDKRECGHRIVSVN